uniref:Large ribosomal subunit protein bL35m n=1 Tax=Plectus sambesii TaxID=2011161 RepID=A0A914X9Z8_9BILA
MSLLNKVSHLIRSSSVGCVPQCAAFAVQQQQCRGIARIPHWENHIRFDPAVGRKRPSQDVLDRFRRLNNGLWVRAVPGKHTKRYRKTEIWQATSEYYVTCTKEECWMLDKMMTPYWLRQRHYADDPYANYHVRHGIKSPRVDYKGELTRERPKVLIEDSVSEQHFYDR